jgi:hypothetical protein
MSSPKGGQDVKVQEAAILLVAHGIHVTYYREERELRHLNLDESLHFENE